MLSAKPSVAIFKFWQGIVEMVLRIVIVVKSESSSNAINMHICYVQVFGACINCCFSASLTFPVCYLVFDDDYHYDFV